MNEAIEKLVEVMNLNNSYAKHTPYKGYQVTETRRKYHLLDSIHSNGQISAMFMIDRESLIVYKADGYGKRGRPVGTVESITTQYQDGNRSYEHRQDEDF